MNLDHEATAAVSKGGTSKNDVPTSIAGVHVTLVQRPRNSHDAGLDPTWEEPQIIVNAPMLALRGYEIMDAHFNRIAWFSCVVDALDAMRSCWDSSILVRCCDSVLLGSRGRSK